MGVACFQNGSLSVPSSFGAWSTRVARATWRGSWLRTRPCVCGVGAASAGTVVSKPNVSNRTLGQGRILGQERFAFVPILRRQCFPQVIEARQYTGWQKVAPPSQGQPSFLRRGPQTLRQ